jgi:hypothetical protein
MSRLLHACRLVAILALVTIPSTVRGQAWHPFADPMEFDPDWQFFAPVDTEYLEELSPRKRANVGWFGTYDRGYTLVTRARQEGGGADFTWQNRYEVGFMNQKNSGWLFTHRNMSGPNVYESQYQSRINQWNEDDEGGIVIGGTPEVFFPSIGRNDPVLRERAYILQDSLNVGSLTSFEVNKTWRMEPYRYGGILEPLVGFRYTNFRDYSVGQNYFRTNVDLLTPGGILTENATEVLETNEWTINNLMLGGQFGFRYFNHYKRWTLSSELRALALQNFRRERQSARSTLTQYSGTGVGDDVVAEITNFPNAVVPAQTTGFVPGFEIRAEAAYQVTKYIDLRGGIDFINLASNVRRGTVETGPFGLPPRFGSALNNSVQMTAFTFGVALNR